MSDLARTTRRGKGLLPGNPKQWRNEHHGLNLREELGVSLAGPLSHEDAFALLPSTIVLPHGSIPAEPKFIERLRHAGARWSGLAVTLPDGSHLVVYNDSHPLTLAPR